MRWMTLLGLWSGCMLTLADQAVAQNAPPPNVVFILSDDQHWSDYSFMGHPQIQTPHIDRLAARSVVYTRGYVPMSLCRPSLATIITGRYPHEHGIVGNDPPFPAEVLALDLTPQQRRMHPLYFPTREQYVQHIDDEATSLPRLLGEQRGYRSLQTGKWWEGHPHRGGFTAAMTHGDPARRGRHGDQGLVIGRQTMDPIRNFLERKSAQRQPFFLWYAPMMPHSPHNPPDRLLAKYADKTPHEGVAAYWAMCEWFDETIGQLMQLLEEHGVADNTIVVYVCDNGWINVPDRDDFEPNSKKSQYDGGLRTPIMVSWPGRATPRRDDTHLASSIDLVPTVLAALQIESPIPLPGINLLDETAVAARERIFGEILDHDVHHMTDPRASLRFRWVIEGDWKLIAPHRLLEPDAPVELFNLKQDPDEQHNLAADHPDKVQQLTARLAEWWNLQEGS